MKTLICVPSMDLVPAQFAHSLACLEKVGECAVSFEISSLIYTSRNKLAARAIKAGADYVLWLDSDMVFEPSILAKLLAHERDIVSGLYFRRVAPFSPVFFDKLEINENGCVNHNAETVPDGLAEVAGVGFGCVLMRTSVLMDVMTICGDMFAPINGVGEDLSFCWRARSLGYRIFLDPSIKCGHVGHHVITEEFFNSFKGVNHGM